MSDEQPSQPEPYAIVAGFGLGGRLIVDALQQRGIAYCVVDRNPLTIRRCAKVVSRIIEGDVADERVLVSAGIERATLVALTMPNEQAVRHATAIARRLNPGCYILARMSYTSGGMQVMRLGANDVVVAEQAVALEFARLLGMFLDQGTRM